MSNFLATHLSHAAFGQAKNELGQPRKGWHLTRVSLAIIKFVEGSF